MGGEQPLQHAAEDQSTAGLHHAEGAQGAAQEATAPPNMSDVAMDYGYTMEGATSADQASAARVVGSRTTAASTSACSSASGGAKPIVKNILKRHSSEPMEPCRVARDLRLDIDAAATPVPEDAHDLDMDQGAATEQEMPCDAEPAPSVEDPDVAFWRRMQMMMDAQTNRLENNTMMVNEQVDKVQVRLEERIDRKFRAATRSRRHSGEGG